MSSFHPFDGSRVATIVIITGDFFYIHINSINIGIYRRGTGERECGERDRLPAGGAPPPPPPRRRSLATGEPLR